MFEKIPANIRENSGNVINVSGESIREDSGQCRRRFRRMLLKALRDVPEDSRECYLRFQGMFEKILRNVIKDSGESSLFQKILENVIKDSGKCFRRFRGT